MTIMRKPTKRLLKTAKTLLLLCTTVSTQTANAEPCRLIGCSNQIFYIFLPDANLTPNANAVLNSSGQRCNAPGGDQTFEHKGLPAVNETATLKAEGRWVYSEQQIEEEVDSFQPAALDRNATGECTVVWKAPDGGGSLDPGTILHVLGYRTFVGHYQIEDSSFGTVQKQTRTYPQQLLFAMVLVE